MPQGGDEPVATTHITPLRIGSGRSVSKALRDSISYFENPEKTGGRELISSYECDIRTADAEFNLAKQRYHSLTGRSQGRNDVIAYHIRQSFKPDEVTAEEANAIGYELVMRFTKGRFPFVVCTHIDKAHIHNHIVFNSTALNCRSKFRSFLGTAFAVRRTSDLICAEHGLSVIDKPGKSKGNNYGRHVYGNDRPPSYRDRLKSAIDAALGKQPISFDDFLQLMRDQGCVVNTGRKHITFLLPGQKKALRCDTLRGDYTEVAIRQRIAGLRISSPAGRTRALPLLSHPGLIFDLQTRMQMGRGRGYERWAKIHNLKQMAQAMIYLEENGIDDLQALRSKVQSATDRFHSLSERMRELEDALNSNSALQKQLVVYSKTRPIYEAYRKAGYSKRFREQHEADILLHQAAKKFFDDLGLQRLPSVASLRSDYTPMLAEKKQLNREYYEARAEMRELLTVEMNVTRLLGVTDRVPERETEKTERDT